MKNTRFIYFYALLFLFVFGGCAQQAEMPQPTATTKPTASDTPQPTVVPTAKPILSTAPDKGNIILANRHYFKTDHSDKSFCASYDNDSEWIMYLETEGTNRVTFQSRGEIVNYYDDQWAYDQHCSEIVARLERTEDYKLIKAKDYFTSDSTGYEKLTDDDILFKTTAHNPIISKVKYVYYENSRESPKDYWVQAAEEILKGVTPGHKPRW